jgi:putative glutamine amidotransferase
LSQKRPLIGCTTYRKTAAQKPPIEVLGLMPSYIEAVAAAGGVPVLIPLGLGDEELGTIFERIDGLLLPGGGDIDPVSYWEQAHATLSDVDKDRDRVEFTLVRAAVTERKPLLAICRGHQVFNVALGGSLWQDIQGQIPASRPHDYNHSYPRNYLAHSVEIQPDSRLAHYLGKRHSPVNSLHHQAIRDVAPELVRTALSPDGVIEAVEVPGHPFAIGVQWHPENLIHDDPAMLALFKGFVQVAGNGR